MVNLRKKPDESGGTKKNLEARLPTAPLGVEMSDMYENYEGGLATNTMSTTSSCKKQCDKSNVCHMNGTVESCMAIYLGMAMEIP